MLSPIATALKRSRNVAEARTALREASHSHTQASVYESSNRLYLVPGTTMSCPVLGNECGMAWIYASGAMALPWNSNT
jgi:hypothetical protein